MSRRERDEAALEAEIARLPDLGHDELRKRWKLLFGRPAPKSLRRKFMARAVAYQMQVAAYGGLSAATKRRLREIAMAIQQWRSHRRFRRGPNQARHTVDPAVAEHDAHRDGSRRRVRTGWPDV